MTTQSRITTDLDAVLDLTRDLWTELRGSRLLITGGSGFFGCWMMESFVWANDRLSLNARVAVLTRDPARLRRRLPHLATHPSVELLIGDVRTFDPPADRPSHVLHMAAEPSGPQYEDDPAERVDVMVSGAKRLLAFTTSARVLFISSGAVYGPQPELRQISEDTQPQAEARPLRRAYAEGKRAMEALASESGQDIVIARPFAFLGPYLPLDSSFAASQFLADALAGRSIRVTGAEAVRSYLYGSDLAVWLWTILLRGQTGRAYNVGSEHAVTIDALASMIAAEFTPTPSIESQQDRLQTASTSDEYVPSTLRARQELGLTETVDVREAVSRTVRWHKEAARATPSR